MNFLFFAFGDFPLRGPAEGISFLTIAADGFGAGNFTEIGKGKDLRHTAVAAVDLSKEISA